MGWQSYIVFYSNQEEANKIIQAMDEYQKIVYSHEPDEQKEEVGEELCMICFSKMLKPYIKPHLAGNFAVMFGVGGGRYSCYNFFVKRQIKITFFEPRMFDRLVKSDNWLIPFKGDYKEFPNNFMEKLIEKNLVEIPTNNNNTNNEQM